MAESSSHPLRVAELWSYPVKSFIGHRVESVELSHLGIVGDRHWAIRENESGSIRGAKKLGELMRLAATPLEHHAPHVTVTFPDGSTVTSRDPDIDERLSAFLDRDVSLVPLPADGNLDHFRRGPAGSDDMVQELRDIFGREADEPLPDFSVFPPEVVQYESPPGTHYDCWALMIMTTSALSSLRGALSDSGADIRRFRPSMVIDSGDDPGHPEFSWTGSRARMGSATIEFLAPCPRCVMVTRPIDGAVPEDRGVLRHIVRELNQNLGVYARIIEPGVVRAGDHLEFIA